MRPESERAHHDLIDQMIAQGALWSQPLIGAFRATPRHLFLERIYRHGDEGWLEVDTAEPTAEALRLIYSDRALTTRLGQSASARQEAVPISSSSQPSLMARMLEDLYLQRGQHVLEIGAGTGYNAALLSWVVGSVISIDVDREVLAEARRHLEALPDREVEFHHADGRDGYPDAAPYDRILVTAATFDLEPAWLEQLAPGGLLLAPVDLGPGLSYLVRGTVRRGVFTGRLTSAAYFMPLRNEEDTGREGTGKQTGSVPAADRLSGMPAPWSHWPDRRSQGNDFLPSLAFLAWLEGLALAQGSLPEGRNGYGIADLDKGNACWLGNREWRVTGAGGRALGERLWRTFLDSGGPAPTEFRLRAAPLGSGLEPAPALLNYFREGPLCEQMWELPEVRTRSEDEE